MARPFMSRIGRLAGRHTLPWLRAGWLMCAIAAVGATSLAAPEDDAGWLALDEAVVFAHDAARPPAPDAVDGVARALPDDWATWRGEDDTPLWYRIRFDAAPGPDDAPLALRIGRACSHFELWLNGRRLYRSAPGAEVGAAACHRPWLVELPPAMLQTGSNRIDLRLAGDARSRVASRQHAAGLSTIELGTLDVLAARQGRAQLWQVYAPMAVSATLLLMGGFMFVLGWRHRTESHLAYFGALSVGWAVVEARRWWPGLPVSAPVAEFVQGAMLAVVALAAVQFLLRYAGYRGPRIRQWMAAQCVLVPVTMAWAGPARLHMAAGLWAAVFALQIAAAAAQHLRLRRRADGRVPRSAAAMLGLAGTALVLDLAGRFVALPAAFSVAAQLAVPLALVVVGLRLMRRQAQALQASEASRAELERRIARATAEIERNFQLMAQLRVDQVTAQERKRIAGDLHDDLGAKLLTIVHTSDDPRIATLAREALEEMRLSVRGLTGRPMRLDDALGDWRAELMGRLAQSGIAGEWQAKDDLAQMLSARAYVQTTRILREATNNIVKHSAASHCSFVADLVGDDLAIVIQDNGRGIPMEIDGRLDRGHGLASMKQRAKQLQGQCLVESAPGRGTVIRLTLPLQEPVPGGP